MCLLLMSLLSNSFSGQVLWDCPECGRTGNAGNYCGGCAHPAPWIDAVTTSGLNFLEQDFKVRKTVTFGRYEQDNNTSNGAEEIEWIVLKYDKTSQKALLLSKYGLDEKQYNATPYYWLNEGYSKKAWEKSTVRAWLNEDFLKLAFDPDEQKAIIATAVDNGQYEKTHDKIFLLSENEANQYLGANNIQANKQLRVVMPTAYAIAQGADSLNAYDGAGWWLLRSETTGVCYILFDGSIQDLARFETSGGCIRPALWLDLQPSFNQ